VSSSKGDDEAHCISGSTLRWWKSDGDVVFIGVDELEMAGDNSDSDL
jgi:hypothetical protein